MSSAIQYYCKTCKSWFYADDECPDCGTPRSRFNKALYTAKVNGNLYDMAASADKEKRYARARGLD